MFVTLLNSPKLYAKPSLSHSMTPTQAHSNINNLESTLSRYLEKLKKTYPDAMIRQRVDRLGVSLMLKLNLELVGETITEKAQNFIISHQQLWGQAKIIIAKVDARKDHHIVHLKGEMQGRPILNQDSKLMIKDGRLVHLNNGIGALAYLVEAKISEERARKLATGALSKQGLDIAKILKGAVSYEPGIAYEIYELRVLQPEKLRTWIVRLDGRDGAIISVKSGEQQ